MPNPDIFSLPILLPSVLCSLFLFLLISNPYFASPNFLTCFISLPPIFPYFLLFDLPILSVSFHSFSYSSFPISFHFFFLLQYVLHIDFHSSTSSLFLYLLSFHFLPYFLIFFLSSFPLFHHLRSFLFTLTYEYFTIFNYSSASSTSLYPFIPLYPLFPYLLSFLFHPYFSISPFIPLPPLAKYPYINGGFSRFLWVRRGGKKC